jgi:23S rRNA pseudouridine1911/1915/1917 synthase
LAKTHHITLGAGSVIPILYEDRAVLAIDKPAGWLLAPAWWEHTARNLQRALESGLQRGEFWARCRHLKFLRFIHRLDADTSGVLLLARSPGALRLFSRLFEGRAMRKTYLAVATGAPRQKEWTCSLPVGRDPRRRGVMQVKGEQARDAVTRFSVLSSVGQRSLVVAEPLTGRTHQIRVHLAATGHPILGDPLYGGAPPMAPDAGLALRAIRLEYQDPFSKRPVRIEAPAADFLEQHGFPASTPLTRSQPAGA